MGILRRITGGGILYRLERIEEAVARLDERLTAVDARLDSLGREEALREEIGRLRTELDGLSQQSLHVVELLGKSRRRVKELEAGGES